MENNTLLSHELEQMRSQIGMLKQKLEQQTIVNDRHIRNSMKSKISDLNHFPFPPFRHRYKNSGAPRKEVSAPMGRTVGGRIVRDATSAASSRTASPRRNMYFFSLLFFIRGCLLLPEAPPEASAPTPHLLL